MADDGSPDGASPSDAAALEAARSLPFESRLAHSNWKARSEAYTEASAAAAAAASAAPGEAPAPSAALAALAAAAPRAASDGNAAALDGALDALVGLLSLGGRAGSGPAAAATSPDAAPRLAAALVARGLGAGARPRTQARACDALLLLLEAGAADAVTDALTAGLASKQPRAAAACAGALLAALRAFGPRVVRPTPLMRAAAPLFDHKDGAVRDAAKELAVELTRWLGADAVKRDLTSKMREAQQKEVGEALDAVRGGPPPAPTRALRGEPPPGAAAAPAPRGGANGGGLSGSGAPGAAPLPAAAAAAAPSSYADLIEAEDILSKLAKRKPGFAKSVQSDNWKERMAAFSDAAALADAAPRLAGGDYGEVTRAVRGALLRDANAAVVCAAVAAAAALASKLGRDYRPDGRALTAPLLDKLRDKALNVQRCVPPLLALLASRCYSLPDVADDAAAALDSKVPAVAAGACAWVAAAWPGLDGAAAARAAATLLPVLTRLAATAPTPAVRDAALLAVAAAAAGGGQPPRGGGGSGGGGGAPPSPPAPASAASAASSPPPPQQPARAAHPPAGLDALRFRKLQPLAASAPPHPQPPHPPAAAAAAPPRSAPSGSSSASAAAAAAAARRPSVATRLARRPASGGAPTRPSAAAAAPSAAPAAAPRASAPAQAAAAPPASAAAAAARRAAAGTPPPTPPAAPADEDAADYFDPGFGRGGPDEVHGEMEALLGSAQWGLLSRRLASPDWEQRAAGADGLRFALAALPRGGPLAGGDGAAAGRACDAVLRSLAAAPGWGDTNSRALSSALAAAAALAAACPAFGRPHAGLVLDAALDRLLDPRTRAAALELLAAIAQRISHRFVALQLHRRCARHRSPKALEACLEWCAAGVAERGAGCPPAEAALLAGLARAALLAPPAAGAKAAALRLCGAAHAAAGGAAVRPALRLAGLPPPLAATVEAVLAKNPHGARGGGAG